MQVFIKRGLDYSVFLFFQTISEEQESGTWIGLFFVVAECETSIEVIAFTSEDLHFIEFLHNELSKLCCTLLELWDSIGFASFFKLCLNFLYVFYYKKVRKTSI